MFEYFDIFAAIVLVVCLYLAYTLHQLRQDFEELAEQSFITRTILFKFIEKIADEKIEAGEWTEDETI
jgi:hypothetical protein